MLYSGMLWLPILALCFNHAESSCKLHNAEWLDTSKGPRVSQPSGSDPTKIKVDWSGMLDDQRCIDRFVIHIWNSAQSPAQARKVRVAGSTSNNKIVDVSPCVTYNFQVEYEQDSYWRDRIKRGKSGTASYRTQGLATINDLGKHNFHVGYLFDRRFGVHNLTKAVVSFKKSAVLKHPDCAGFLRIRGDSDPVAHYASPLMYESVYVARQAAASDHRRGQVGNSGTGEARSRLAGTRTEQLDGTFRARMGGTGITFGGSSGQTGGSFGGSTTGGAGGSFGGSSGQTGGSFGGSSTGGTGGSFGGSSGQTGGSFGGSSTGGTGGSFGGSSGQTGGSFGGSSTGGTGGSLGGSSGQFGERSEILEASHFGGIGPSDRLLFPSSVLDKILRARNITLPPPVHDPNNFPKSYRNKREATITSNAVGETGRTLGTGDEASYSSGNNYRYSDGNANHVYPENYSGDSNSHQQSGHSHSSGSYSDNDPYHAHPDGSYGNADPAHTDSGYGNTVHVQPDNNFGGNTHVRPDSNAHGDANHVHPDSSHGNNNHVHPENSYGSGESYQGEYSHGDPNHQRPDYSNRDKREAWSGNRKSRLKRRATRTDSHGSGHSGYGSQGGSFNSGYGSSGGSMNGNHGYGSSGGSMNGNYGYGSEGGSLDSGYSHGSSGGSMNGNYGYGSEGGSFDSGYSHGSSGGSMNGNYGYGSEGGVFNSGYSDADQSRPDHNSHSDGQYGNHGSQAHGSYGSNVHNQGQGTSGNHLSGGGHSHGDGPRQDYGSINSWQENRLRRETTANWANPNGVANPPFDDIVRIVLDVEPCVPYQFHLEVHSQQGRVIGNVRDLLLPPLELQNNLEMPDLVHTYEMGKELDRSCLLSYLTAVNNKVLRSNDKISWYSKQSQALENLVQQPCKSADQSNGPAAPVPDPNTLQKMRLLERFGCGCNMSPYIRLNTTDEKAQRYYPKAFGLYEASGKLHAGRPFYEKRVSGTESYYVYFDDSSMMWCVGEALGKSSPSIYIDDSGNAARCPADSDIRGESGKGYYSGLITWKELGNFSITCGVL